MSNWRGRIPLLKRRPPRIFLHIGAMKTGTTYLQDLMSANRDQLARAGILFPGERWSEQSSAAADALGFKISDLHRKAELAGAWDAMVEKMTTWRGKASVFSMEFLSFADEEQAARIVSSLEGAEVHVILTVRDAAETIPAQWQTVCRNGGRITYRRFVYGVKKALDAADDTTDRSVRMLQRTQGVRRMLDVWVPLVGAENVHVITVPPRGSDPDLLWQRFASVIDIDPATATEALAGANPSLGHASTELVRRINVALGPMTRGDQASVMKGPFARRTLGPRASEEKKIRLHRRGLMFAARWNRRARTAIKQHEVQLVGTLADLPVRRPPASAPKRLHRPSPTDLLAAAATGREGLQRMEQELAEQVRSRGGAPVLATAPSPDEGDLTDQERVDLAVTELAALARSCMNLRHELKRLGATDQVDGTGDTDDADDLDVSEESASAHAPGS